MVYSYRFITLTSLFITCVITANILIVKQIAIFGLTLPAAIIIFPLSYIFGDVLTEVYGYRQARKVIWLGFFCNLVAVIAIWIVGILPPAPVFEAQAAYERILSGTPRFLGASFLAYMTGEFLNSYVLAKMKLITRGKWLWSRTIASTFVGEAADTAIVLIISFWGALPADTLGMMILGHWLLKCAYEIVATPLTYMAVGYLKKKEGIDHYDYNTNFNPLQVN